MLWTGSLVTTPLELTCSLSYPTPKQVTRHPTLADTMVTRHPTLAAGGAAVVTTPRPSLALLHIGNHLCALVPRLTSLRPRPPALPPSVTSPLMEAQVVTPGLSEDQGLPAITITITGERREEEYPGSH